MPSGFGWTVLAFVVVALLPGAARARGSGVVILSTTTSTQDSGLLDVLVPMFERASGYTLKPIAVGTGQALALAPELEERYVAEGKLLNRRLVMYNDFVIVGPPDDPAGISGLRDAAHGVHRIAAAGARFVSRGDTSGTHLRERALWREARVPAAGPWYLESGQGMGATLVIAHDRRAYTLSDRATYLAFRTRLALAILVEGDRRLRNVYAVLEVNPANGPRVNAAGGKAFADFIVSPQAQRVIASFGVDRYGQPLFVPIAGKKPDDLSRGLPDVAPRGPAIPTARAVSAPLRGGSAAIVDLTSRTEP